MPSLSVVVPVYNEEKNVRDLHAEIVATLRHLKYKSEIIFVNDGSTDGTLAALKSLKGVTILNLNRNYGQATALDAGFKAAEGDVIVSLDGDGQNDPRDIPLLVHALEEKHVDVIAGWRKNRKDEADIRMLTRIGRQLRKSFISDPIHDSGCTLRAYTNEAVKSLDIGGEMHRYILALLRWKGFSIAEVEVNHRERVNGVSKYNSQKAARGFIDLLYIWFIHKYSQRPLHLFGYLSFFSFFCGILAAAWTLYNSIYLGIHFARDVWVVVAFFFFLSAMLFFCFGIVIDLLIRIHLNISPYEKRYYIRDTIKT
ncbi:MAG: glycosyltransferase family 2 protein [Minisyncoccia bacterium]